MGACILQSSADQPDEFLDNTKLDIEIQHLFNGKWHGFSMIAWAPPSVQIASIANQSLQSFLFPRPPDFTSLKRMENTWTESLHDQFSNKDLLHAGGSLKQKGEYPPPTIVAAASKQFLRIFPTCILLFSLRRATESTNQTSHEAFHSALVISPNS